MYGKGAHDPIPNDPTKKVCEDRVKRIQQIIGGILYYARAVDSTTLSGRSSITSEQAQATEKTKMKVKQLLDYLATMPDTKIRYHKSEMILNIHSDASYLSESRAQSRVAGYYYMGSNPVNGQPVPLNKAICVLGGIFKFVVASAAEA